MQINYSIIIPHKNTPELLQRCFDSIQQRNDVEVIIVDNNSSPDILDFEHYPGSERSDVTIIKDNNSIGAGGARNTGLFQAKGKWVLFADADDYYEKGFIDVLDKYVNTEDEIIYFNQNVLINGKTINRYFKYVDRYCADDEDTIIAIKYKHHVPWNKMIRRDFLIQNHIFFEDCIVGNDILFTFLCGYYSTRISVEKRKIYNYVINPNSIIHKNKHSQDYYLCLFNHIYQSNAFFDFIQHTELKRSVYSRLLSIFLKKGFLQAILALSTFRNYKLSIVQSQSMFVDQINRCK